MRTPAYMTALVVGGLACLVALAGCPQEPTEMVADEVPALEPAPADDSLTEAEEPADADVVPGDQGADAEDGAGPDAAPSAPRAEEPSTQPRPAQPEPARQPQPQPESPPAPTRAQRAAPEPADDATPGPQSRAGPGRRGDGERRGGPFERFDENGDGLLTAGELPDEFRERMMRADANGDGAISREELEEAGRSWRGGGGPGDGADRRGRLFERLDENDDGVLTDDELPGEMAERMMQADANGDGKLSRDELEQSRRARGGQRPGGPGGE